MTAAERVAAQYDDNGEQWVDGDGVGIGAACETAGGVKGLIAYTRYEATWHAPGYRFADGSAIIELGELWDVLAPAEIQP